MNRGWFASTGDFRVQINVSARHGSLSGPDGEAIREKVQKAATIS